MRAWRIFDHIHDEEAGDPELVRRSPTDDPQRGTRDFGTAWAQESRSLALLTPSVIVPFDRNVVRTCCGECRVLATARGRP